MDVQIDAEKLRSELASQFKIEELRQQFAKFKAGWGWNISKDKTVWQALQQNLDLLYETSKKVVIACQNAAKKLNITDNSAKLEAAVEFLDEIVVLPFYLEFFDDKIFRIILTFAYKSLKDKLGADFAAKVGL